ncbi:ABC transporter permease [Serratia sp. UGAL515B_01]|uniref:ABC transporter permease n=1 Tax=Serratia sp. UGAL515B_01 TaxID=2986763 RepID=UPI00295533AB|nr:ABC transporter permease [Serratia sp. UGAL515B_01]WON78272.1 ABC transporter permease [Serratia sp. UGAL515B_01]
MSITMDQDDEKQPRVLPADTAFDELRQQVDAAVSIEPISLNASLTIFLNSLARLPHASIGQRRAIYQAIQAGQESGLARIGADEATVDFRYRQLRMIIRYLELDIRAGVDVQSDGYRSTELEREHQRLETSYATRVAQQKSRAAREARLVAGEMAESFTPSEAAQCESLGTRLNFIHAKQQLRPLERGASWPTTLGPLVSYLLHVIHNESRVALLWAFLGPAVLLGLISAPYFLTGVRYILGMDVATFSLLGAITWIMFRQIIFRSSTNYVGSRVLIHLGVITPLQYALSYALIYLGIFLAVYLVLLSVGAYLNLVTLPAQWMKVLFYVLMMALGATSMGILFGSIASFWPYFLRFSAVIERFLQVFSSVFLVSEQLPEEYRKYFLWSPFAHGMQLLRSAYFDNYVSEDASLSYFLIALTLLVAISLLAERLARSNVQPM